MNTREIQIRFPVPGEWGKFSMVCLFPDGEQAGFGRQVVRTAEDLTAEQAQGFTGVVQVLATMAEPWQAVFVRARLEVVSGGVSAPLAQGMEGEEHSSSVPEEGIVLEVEAVNERGARRRFTVGDYPQFRFTDNAVVELFKQLTTENNEQQ